MTEFEDLLRHDMTTATLSLQPSPTLLAQARLRGRTQRRRRRALLVTVPVLAGVALTASLTHGLSDAPARPETLSPAHGPSASAPAVAAWPGVAADPGPDDAALRAADWFSLANRSQQAGSTRMNAEERWYGRNGLTYGNLDGTLKKFQNQDAPLAKRNPGVMVGSQQIDFRGVLDLPTDPIALTSRLARQPGEGEAADSATDLLLQPAPVTWGVRRSLVQIMAAGQHVTVEPAVTDSLGRRALRYTRSGSGSTDQQLYVDPETWRVLEYRDVAVGGPRALPTEGPAPSATPAPGSLIFISTFYDWGTGAPSSTPVSAPPAAAPGTTPVELSPIR